MIIDFKEATPEGEVEFSGNLSKEEVDFLLRYALLSMLARGLLPAAVVAKFPNDRDDSDDVIDPEKLN